MIFWFKFTFRNTTVPTLYLNSIISPLYKQTNKIKNNKVKGQIWTPLKRVSKQLYILSILWIGLTMDTLTRLLVTFYIYIQKHRYFRYEIVIIKGKIILLGTLDSSVHFHNNHIIYIHTDTHVYIKFVVKRYTVSHTIYGY